MNVRELNTKGNPAGECVLYVMSRNLFVEGNTVLVAAQKRALELRAPLAVVFCAPHTFLTGTSPQLQKVSELESILNTLSIPLMVVVGKASDSLAAVTYHTNPAVVYFDHDPLLPPLSLSGLFMRSAAFTSVTIASLKGGQDKTLEPHPYIWPGVIIKIADLLKNL